MTSDLPHGEGLAALLDYARRHQLTADLDAAIEDLKAQVAAGTRGFSPLLLEALEEAHAQRHARVKKPSV